MLLSLNTCGNTASVALGMAGENEVRIVATFYYGFINNTLNQEIR